MPRALPETHWKHGRPVIGSRWRYVGSVVVPCRVVGNDFPSFGSTQAMVLYQDEFGGVPQHWLLSLWLTYYVPVEG